MSGPNSVGSELGRGLTAALSDEQRAHRLAGGQLARERDCLKRQLVDLAAVVLDQDEYH